VNAFKNDPYPPAQFGTREDHPAPQYKGATTQSLYVTMRDGVKIAVDVNLPKDLPAGAQVPAVLIMARYWRSFQLRMEQPGKVPMGPRPAIADFLVCHGYAVIIVDARGSGASFGTWKYLFSREEIKDFGEVAAWVIEQPWSNGIVGAIGHSYEDTTAELLTVAQPEIVKAVADTVIHRFINFRNPQRAVIGAWSHNLETHGSPYAKPKSPPIPKLKAQWGESLRFFDHYLKGVHDKEISDKVLLYFTMGEEKCKSTPVWPPAGTTMRRWYLAQDTEITGHPIVTLYVTSTADDGAFYVYLEDVDERGKGTYVTEGLLRAIHRKVSDAPPPYKMLVPYHSFKRQDAMPLVPGEVAELNFGLLPTSVLIKKGHRIRIAIAGHDKDTFARIPAEGRPVISVARNTSHASFIELPVVQVR
jgi:predicted acyl esterase